MVSPHADPHAHEHEWRLPQDPSFAFEYEDGALHVFEHCEYVEQKSAGTSERLDETFYETVYECEAVRARRYDLSRIERLEKTENGHESVETLAETRDELQDFYDESPALFEKLEQRGAARLLGRADDVDEPRAYGLLETHHGRVEGPTHIGMVIEVDDSFYLLRWSKSGVKRVD